MAVKKARKRSNGAGSVYRDSKTGHYFWKYKIGDRYKTKLLRNNDDTPCTSKETAQDAAEILLPVLNISTREDLQAEVTKVRKLKRRSGLLVREAWRTFLEQPDRPDSGKKTLSQYQGAFTLFLKWLAKNHPEILHVSDISEDAVSEYFASLWNSGVSASTYNSYRQAVGLVFHYLMKPAALEKNPVEEVKKKTAEIQSRKEFTQKQVEAIFAGFDQGFFYETEIEQMGTGRKRIKKTVTLEYKPKFKDQMRVLLNLCCWTGCRGQDACLMQWGSVDLQRNVISFAPIKTARKTGGRVVTIPIHPNLYAALIDALSWKERNKPGIDYILPDVADRYRRNPTGIQKDVMKIIRCATGLETRGDRPEDGEHRQIAANFYSLHSFRHSFVSFCANSGVPLAVVAEIVGHGNPAMTRHYSHINGEAKQRAIASLPIFRTNEVKK